MSAAHAEQDDGKPYRKTPVFTANMDHIVINPTWTVPPIILRKDILPKVQADRDYLKQRNLKVFDGNGVEMDTSAMSI